MDGLIGAERLDAKELPLRTFLQYDAPIELRQNLKAAAQSQIQGLPESADAYLGFIADNPAINDIKAFRGQIKDKKEIWRIATSQEAYDDINYAADILGSLFRRTGITELKGKTLQQLVAKAEEAQQIIDIESSKALLERSAMTEAIKQRTIDLNKTQGLPTGFVELKTPQDFAAETEFLNICIGGAGIRPDGTYKPAFHPVTGKQMIQNRDLEDSTYEAYQQKVKNGTSRFFSYRPEGLPQLTLDVRSDTGALKEVRGLNNRDPTYDENKIIQEGLRQIFTHSDAGYTTRQLQYIELGLL